MLSTYGHLTIAEGMVDDEASDDSFGCEKRDDPPVDERERLRIGYLLTGEFECLRMQWSSFEQALRKHRLDSTPSDGGKVRGHGRMFAQIFER